ncbi:MAG: hypothetical protein GXO36_05650 [Chloroflexi bacterium]|nr:hypothetical protein [Chloroflexota bacterium]
MKTLLLVGLVLFLIFLPWFLREQVRFWGSYFRLLQRATRRVRNPWAEEDALIQALRQQVAQLQASQGDDDHVPEK